LPQGKYNRLYLIAAAVGGDDWRLHGNGA
jgi:hypothetical protein